MATRSATARQSATTAQSNTTLRVLLEARRNEGRRMSLDEAVAVIVPVCMDLNERHARGERLYVHPSAIAAGADGLARLDPRLALMPTQAFDKHCLAPELQRTLEPGDACSSVFSIGAMLYEMVTGLHIGSAMKRPREIEPSLPESLEVLDRQVDHRRSHPPPRRPGRPRERALPCRSAEEHPPARYQRVPPRRERAARSRRSLLDASAVGRARGAARRIGTRATSSASTARRAAAIRTGDR